ncbi:MAG TPA: thioredoxin fold domain-containing protein [Burkholderiales bacterium]|nr:thioredoxin fold domain-containing protein [Burkholderiales bacterium]
MLPGAAAATELPPAVDLRRDATEAQARRVPLLVLFSLQDCAYCERVRQEFLLPAQDSPEWSGRVIMRQVEMKSPRALTDFAGRATSHGKFAREQRIRVAPTVKVFDTEGREAAEPLVGLLTPELYGVYLERALQEGLARTRQGRELPPR